MPGQVVTGPRCPVCGKQFKNIPGLIGHLRLVHPERSAAALQGHSPERSASASQGASGSAQGSTTPSAPLLGKIAEILQGLNSRLRRLEEEASTCPTFGLVWRCSKCRRGDAAMVPIGCGRCDPNYTVEWRGFNPDE